MKRTYEIKGMHCASCSSKVEAIALKTKGINSASVNLLQSLLNIETDSKFSEVELVKELDKAGFELIISQEKASQMFTLRGMSCSACVSAVERILSKFEEIDSVTVNLLLESISITYQRKNVEEWSAALAKADFILVEQANTKNIIFAIDPKQHDEAVKYLKTINGIGECLIRDNNIVLNYDISIIKINEIIGNLASINIDAKYVEEEEMGEVKKSNMRIYLSLGLALILLYIGMSHMINSLRLPLPEIIDDRINPQKFAFVQFVLASIILGLGNGFFVRGIKAIIHKAPTMDSLVAIGTGCAYVYSLFSMYQVFNDVPMAVHQLYFESAGIVVALVQFGKHLESKAKQKSTSAISALLKLRPKKAVLWRNEKEESVYLEEICVNDIVVCKAGESIPVDGTIIFGKAFIDESLLSGESMPLNKGEKDPVFQGSFNMDGRLLIQTSAAIENTTLAKIINLVQEAQSKKAPIARIADRISMYFVPSVMVIALLSAITWYIINQDLNFALTIFVSVLLIACPCALGLATPTAIMVGSGKGAQLGLFIKSGEALESASHVDTIVFDKTGTITIGKPVVANIVSDYEHLEMIKLAATLEQGSKHPIAAAFNQAIEEAMIGPYSLSDAKISNGLGVSGIVNQQFYQIGSSALMNNANVDIKKYESEMLAYQSEGKSVIFLADDHKVLALFGISDVIKKDSKKVIEILRKNHYHVILLSGDQQVSAEAIAREAGISEVIANVLPDEKGDVIARLQQNGQKVAMVGDGINDAIALAQSDIGIAIGSGSDVAIESADIVLMSEQIRGVYDALLLSKAVLVNIKQNLFWAFFYNILGIPLAAGIFTIFGGPLLSPVFAGFAMAFSSISVVLNALRLRFFKVGSN